MAQSTHSKGRQQKQAVMPGSKTLSVKISGNKWIWLTAILVLTFIAFYPALKCEFTNWDDNVYIEENDLVKTLNSDNIKNIFSINNPVSLNYHPFTILSLAIDHHFSKLAPFRYHLVNLFIHLLNTALVFFFVYKLSRQKIFVALIVTLFFGIHPMHVESVAWVSERKDVLYAFFFIAALITYLFYGETRKPKFIIFTFLLFFLSVLSKAMAVVFPLALLLLDYYNGRKITPKVIAEKIPFFIVSLLAGWLALHIQSRSAIAAANVFTLPQQISFGFYGFIIYIWKMLFPTHLSAFYPYPMNNTDGKAPFSFYIIALCGILLFIFVCVMLLLKKKKAKIITFGVGFYFITIVTVLQFLSVGQAIMADRYTYISYIGLLFAIAMFVNNLVEKKPGLKNPVMIMILAIGVLFAFLTNDRTEVWKNSETLWTDVIEKYPFPPWMLEVGYEHRANYYASNESTLDKGLADYEVLLKMKTKNYNVYNNAGSIYSQKGQEFAKEGNAEKANEFAQKSVDLYNHALSLNDKDANVYINLAMTNMFTKQYYLAALNFGKATNLHPGDMDLIKKQSLAYFYGGNFKEALNDFTILTQRDPQNGSTWFNLSVCYKKLGDNSNALMSAEKAQRLGHPVDKKYMEELQNTQN